MNSVLTPKVLAEIRLLTCLVEDLDRGTGVVKPSAVKADYAEHRNAALGRDNVRHIRVRWLWQGEQVHRPMNGGRPGR